MGSRPRAPAQPPTTTVPPSLEDSIAAIHQKLQTQLQLIQTLDLDNKSHMDTISNAIAELRSRPENHTTNTQRTQTPLTSQIGLQTPHTSAQQPVKSQSFNSIIIINPGLMNSKIVI
ncbi:hypothetical protein Scep_030858 [Stephania cephalantha]|uniref:Uncharacterized protein n=1 Tax=Stephania cephalantha TaxID=152367 RepID=A0AAP0HGW4_9MAGN